MSVEVHYEKSKASEDERNHPKINKGLTVRETSIYHVMCCVIFSSFCGRFTLFYTVKSYSKRVNERNGQYHKCNVGCNIIRGGTGVLNPQEINTIVGNRKSNDLAAGISHK